MRRRIRLPEPVPEMPVQEIIRDLQNQLETGALGDCLCEIGRDHRGCPRYVRDEARRRAHVQAALNRPRQQGLDGLPADLQEAAWG